MKLSVAANYLSAGLIVFVVFVVTGIFIYPDSLSANAGVSYFGVQEKTSLMYILTFVFNALISWWVASQLSRSSSKNIRTISYILVLMGICYLGLVLTPHTVFSPIHRVFGSSLFVIQLVSCLIILLKFKNDLLNRTLLILAFMSGLASLLYLFVSNGYMLESQIVFQFAVWATIIRFLRAGIHY